MKNLLAKYAGQGLGRIAYDVGSYNVNGTYRSWVENLGWTYIGLDITKGRNVDIQVPKRGNWYPDVLDKKADLVISGQCLEHTEWPWEWIKQVKGLIAPKGVLLLIAPSMWPMHRYPIDCWRILPDGAKALAEWAGLEFVDSWVSNTRHADMQDCTTVMRNSYE